VFNFSLYVEESKKHTTIMISGSLTQNSALYHTLSSTFLSTTATTQSASTTKNAQHQKCKDGDKHSPIRRSEILSSRAIMLMRSVTVMGHRVSLRCGGSRNSCGSWKWPVLTFNVGSFTIDWWRRGMLLLVEFPELLRGVPRIHSVNFHKVQFANCSSNV
jgi:hypothetical protein